MVRSYISDFAVISAILVMVLVDLAFGINTPKLVVPSTVIRPNIQIMNFTNEYKWIEKV